MVWGVITPLVLVISSMLKARLAQYLRILEESLLSTLDKYGLDLVATVYQQDNTPAHRSKATAKWLDEHNIKTLPCPANSPDANIIKHVWHYCQDRLW